MSEGGADRRCVPVQVHKGGVEYQEANPRSERQTAQSVQQHRHLLALVLRRLGNQEDARGRNVWLLPLSALCEDDVVCEVGELRLVQEGVAQCASEVLARLAGGLVVVGQVAQVCLQPADPLEAFGVLQQVPLHRGIPVGGAFIDVESNHWRVGAEIPMLRTRVQHCCCIRGNQCTGIRALGHLLETETYLFSDNKKKLQLKCHFFEFVKVSESL